MTSLTVKLFCSLGITFVYVLNSSAQILQPCKINDGECITKSAKAAFPQIMAGIPSAGLEASDPLYIKEIVGDLSGLKYNFQNSELSGFKNCDVGNVKFDVDKSQFHCELTCLDVFIKGDYTINGQLIILPVQGQGKYNITANKYLVDVDAETRKVDGKDGKTHLNIKTFKLKLESQDSIIFKFDNLFNGQQDLSDAVHKFANENWKEVSEFVQEPVFKTAFKKVIHNVNRYLKTVPYEDLFLQ